MAATKAELVKEAKSMGIPLTGEETVAELKELIGKNDEEEDDDNVEDAAVSAEDEEIAAASQAVDEAQATLALAKEELVAAEEAKKAAVKASHPVADPTKHIYLGTGSGEDMLVDAPEGWNKDRRINYHGTNYEVVRVSDDGVWCYRHM